MHGWWQNYFLSTSASYKSHMLCFPEQPALLLLDNHDSHMSYLIAAAKEMGLQILTIPQYISNKLQPLDVTIYLSLKSYFYQAIENLVRNHSGEPVTEYKISELLGVAFPKALMPLNIMSHFPKVGIYPFNPDALQEFYDASVDLWADTDNSLH